VDGYVARVKAFALARAHEVLARYPVVGSPSEAWAAVVTDRTYAWPEAEVNRDLSRWVPTYAYEFADRQAPWMSGVGVPSFPTGACHISELQYLFHADGYEEPLTSAQQRLSGQMIDYWTRFAHAGNPNGPAHRTGRAPTGTPRRLRNLSPESGPSTSPNGTTWTSGARSDVRPGQTMLRWGGLGVRLS